MQPTFVKKTVFLNQEYLTKAQRLLNARTEKDTVNRALELVVEDEEILAAHREVGRKGSGNQGVRLM